MANRQPPSPFVRSVILRAVAAVAFLGLVGFGLGPSCASSGSQTSSHSLGGGTSESTTPTGGGGAGGGTAGGGGSSACKTGEKKCKGDCVAVDDPDYGCTDTSCTPCEGSNHAHATCKDKKCAIGSCDTGFTNCNGDFSDGCETNTGMDPTQCGACGHVCITPGATPDCVNGHCKIGACDAGKTDCNNDPTDGCEADLDNDPQNCQTCLHACAVGESCQNGMCGNFCPPGLGDCDNNPNNGCETVLHTNTDCAFCGDACMLPHATSDCDTNGTCNITLCDQGWQNCDTNPANGCEIHLDSDVTNCGTCGHVCPSGPHSTANCNAGTCSLVCDPGYKDCDGDPATGCEAHTDVDPQNCGTCANVCNVANGTAGCTGGMCTITGCNGGFANCDSQVPDGCEVNTNTDPQHCGSCTNVCNFPHATPSCNNGSCGILACIAPFQNCDGSVGNGCEANTTSDVNNCGMCGNVCSVAHGTAACVNSVCTIAMCNPGFQDCDGQVSNGCEVNTNTDPTHCGGCGTACNLAHATAACTVGVCTVAVCDPGFKNCNNQDADGCEIQTSNDPNNCGSCNNQCSVSHGSATCNAGMCAIAGCNAPWANCNGLYADGCEVNTSTDNGNCGACNNSCTNLCTGHVTATQCVASACDVNGCANGFFDVDNVCSNGCECQDLGTSSNCNSPNSIGTLAVGGSTSYTGNLPASAGDDGYVTVTFNGPNQLGYHPHVQIAPAAEFEFDILTTCGGMGFTCGNEGGLSTGKTNWEVFYKPSCASGSADCDPNSYPVTGSHFIPITPVGTVIIHVYRKTGQPRDCNSFTLTVTN